MTEMDRLRAQLIDHEGLKLRPYRCTAGKLTIGCGRNLQDCGISKSEAMHLLDNDIAECIADLATLDWFPRMDAVRQRAVIDLRFNIGPVRYRGFTRMNAALADQRYGDAADELKRSKWWEQVGPERRERIARMVRLGVDA